jgi:thiol:disulfide interchange protein
VFPMIPLTVSFFTKRSPTRQKGIANAIIYSTSIILIYVILGFLVTVTLGSDALNAMASNVFFNMLFFVIFFIFALSFFGAFEITLPSSWVNKADQASDKGGLVGIFFMAFTLSLVSFSCTGPIIGTLLVEAARGSSYLGPIMGMTGFALALALPFGLFAAFPGWLNTLPKSGGWLNSVKVVLGFLELALAMKFLSNVDLAYHWGLLKREVFIAIWIVIFGLMGLYLLGKLKFSHDSDMHHLGTGRLIVAIITLSFTVYLIPGLWGAPLRAISGFPPPDFYKEWTLKGETGSASHSETCPHNLNCFHDYEEGMAYAQQVGKPVMIDFTGWSCVNCRKMEDNVWSQPAVLKIISEDYVLISLYVDDKTPLPNRNNL